MHFDAERSTKPVFWEGLGIFGRLNPVHKYGGTAVFISFFVLLYSTQSKPVGWNKRSGSTNRL